MTPPRAKAAVSRARKRFITRNLATAAFSRVIGRSEGSLTVHAPETTALPRILIVTGAMAAGKSTVAQALAERLPKAVHLRGDVFRRMIVTGRVDPSPGTEDAWLGQLQLRQTLAVQAAVTYAAAGFSVIYQDILTNALPDILEDLSGWKPGVVVLCPRAETLADRDAARAKTGYVGWTPAAFDAMVRAQTPPVGLWLDNSDLTPKQTVDHILQHAAQTRAGIAA